MIIHQSIRGTSWQLMLLNGRGNSSLEEEMYMGLVDAKLQRSNEVWLDTGWFQLLHMFISTND